MQVTDERLSQSRMERFLKFVHIRDIRLICMHVYDLIAWNQIDRPSPRVWVPNSDSKLHKFEGKEGEILIHPIKTSCPDRLTQSFCGKPMLPGGSWLETWRHQQMPILLLFTPPVCPSREVRIWDSSINLDHRSLIRSKCGFLRFYPWRHHDWKTNQAPLITEKGRFLDCLFLCSGSISFDCQPVVCYCLM